MFGRLIVNVAFQLDDGVSRSGRIAQPDPQGIGTLTLFATKTVPHPGDIHGWAPEFSQGGHDCCSRGGHQLKRGGIGDNRRLHRTQNIERGGGRHRQFAMRRPYPAVAQRQWGGIDFINPQQIESGRHPHNIDNRIERAHFVEVDIVGGDAMHLGFGFGKRGKHRQGITFDSRGELGVDDDLIDIVQMAMGGLLGGLDIHLRAR